MHISFLLHNAYGIGGTIRTTFTLASTLAQHHDVEIVSVFRHRESPTLGAPDGVRMRHLVDLRKKSPGYDGEDPEHARPATVFPRGDTRHKQYSRLTDSRIAAHLGALEADVVVGTRPGLNVHISRQARRGPVRVGQEHLTLQSHGYRLRREIRHRYGLLDAVTTVTEADARDYRTGLRLPGVRIEAIPNSVPAPSGPPATGDDKWIVAAGRLHRVKRYDVLVRAFAEVAAARPEWRLRIYGAGDATGNEQQALRGLVDELGLRERVHLMGSVHPMEAEWPKASIAAVTSERESFGMTIVEAMRGGLPVVATDCPHGPAEIIQDGTDGRLVPLGDTQAFAAALRSLVDDDDLRHRMGRAALASSARFDPEPIAGRHERLFTELIARGSGSRSQSALRTALHRSKGSVLDGAYALRYKAAAVVRGGTGR
ncbi:MULTISPECIES: glycosyltransferase family 4 protein [unclassified Streptomyces]|uniref:glycosyltransferase family 4 protein n=1 Tax=Streptomyces TaxID=1883 RepID=UPI0001C18FB3|nr:MULTISPECIES: glycosyltransferase family 4 protein [unclassified Streptomyces]AEN09106.1 glycosyl transferase group 1 [Streptomyces sp. SirexAA-E]MYR67993.1 glycosyltransferase [Streptomyces sp. SID4939]MYS04297.1 glycosyltransferase [Streptomyces sp. SID4940]MYT62469.1 glycosyltransferase [Streptomyces sp. SID8357]MYT85471.1 glycosyltransferase [Streptomyces sp. SID8360]